jgi:hypothetical protein
MSDFMAAYIRLGGIVPRQLVEPLCLALTRQKLSLQWGEARFAPASGEELLEVRTKVEGADVLQLCDDDAPWGEFRDLEKFLIEHSIGFDRFHEAKCDTNARLTQFRPGVKPIDFYTAVEGHVVVPLRDVHYLRDDLHEVRDLLQQKQFEQGEHKLQTALANLARRVKEPFPPLASLVIATD